MNFFHLIHHEDCCPEKISEFVSANGQLYDPEDDDVFWQGDWYEIEKSMWLVSGETRIDLSRVQICGYFHCGFLLSNDHDEEFAWSFGDSNRDSIYGESYNRWRFHSLLKNVNVSQFV